MLCGGLETFFVVLMRARFFDKRLGFAMRVSCSLTKISVTDGFIRFTDCSDWLPHGLDVDPVTNCIYLQRQDVFCFL